MPGPRATASRRGRSGDISRAGVPTRCPGRRGVGRCCRSRPSGPQWPGSSAPHRRWRTSSAGHPTAGRARGGDGRPTPPPEPRDPGPCPGPAGLPPAPARPPLRNRRSEPKHRPRGGADEDQVRRGHGTARTAPSSCQAPAAGAVLQVEGGDKAGPVAGVDRPGTHGRGHPQAAPRRAFHSLSPLEVRNACSTPASTAATRVSLRPTRGAQTAASVATVQRTCRVWRSKARSRGSCHLGEDQHAVRHQGRGAHRGGTGAAAQEPAAAALEGIDGTCRGELPAPRSRRITEDRGGRHPSSGSTKLQRRLQVLRRKGVGGCRAAGLRPFPPGFPGR